MHWENTDENNLLFPERRKWKLDAGVMDMLGITQKVMRDKNFYIYTG